LDLISIFHYVFAGLCALGGCIPIIHLTIGLVLLFAPNTFATPNGTPPPTQLIGVMFTALASVAILLGWSLAICVFLGARSIARRKNYLFCLIVAGICCMFVPIGTALGVFSIVVLIRPSVKALFDNPQNGQSFYEHGKP
jgi:hypothetical protein